MNSEERKVDWSKPIEAVHEDGRVQSVAFERAREAILDAAGVNSGWIELPMEQMLNLLVAFADAEAAAMRERAAVAARDALVRHEWPPQDGDVQCDEVIAAIRTLPTTGEVGRASERQRYITTWRKRPPESVLDWDHYVSEDDAELEGVIKNLKAQGVKQWNTFRLGERVASLSSEH